MAETRRSVVLDHLAAVQYGIAPGAHERAQVVDAAWVRLTFAGIPTLRAPYPSVRRALWAGWYKHHGLPRLPGPAEAVREASLRVRQAEADTGRAIQRVWEQARFPDTVQRMLATGVLVGVAAMGVGVIIGAAAGVGFAGVGAIIGAAAGFVVGCVYAILPIAQWNVLGTFTDYAAALTPAERYLHLGMFRTLFDENAARDRQRPYKPWSIGETFRTIWTSDGTILFLSHALTERDCFPRPSQRATLQDLRGTLTPEQIARAARGESDGYTLADLDPVSRYALGWVAAERQDHEPLEGSELWNQIMAGRGSPWLRELVTPFRTMRAGAIREQIIKSGVADYGTPPITPDIAAALPKAA